MTPAAWAAAARLTSTEALGALKACPRTWIRRPIQQAIEEIKKTLQIGRGGGGENAGARSDFESILGQMFGKR